MDHDNITDKHMQQLFGYQDTSIWKSNIVSKDFQTWFLVGWQYNDKLIKSNIRESVLSNVDYNSD